MTRTEHESRSLPEWGEVRQGTDLDGHYKSCASSNFQLFMAATCNGRRSDVVATSHRPADLEADLTYLPVVISNSTFLSRLNRPVGGREYLTPRHWIVMTCRKYRQFIALAGIEMRPALWENASKQILKSLFLRFCFLFSLFLVFIKAILKRRSTVHPYTTLMRLLLKMSWCFWYLKFCCLPAVDQTSRN